ncbi:sex-determining protein Fem1-like protein [Sarcoptes scabiei]|uniref:Sex-determining protein Fem1-like protein n=1 Tax=Sarcoptes scabiei TaxID=52283 RepID=A0A131ZWU0_SARSC|nr:sex-determining protein Fem1-like protein [Sarcoptes scabiei]
MDYQFFDAVFNGDLDTIKNQFKDLEPSKLKALAESRIENTTSLLIAIRYNHFEIIRFLIENCHVDIEQVGDVEFDGVTVQATPPLWCAAAAGNLECVKLLLEHGANVNSTTTANSTPLRAACFDGHYEIVRLLVENGADIEIANKLGHTCLMISCYKRHFKIASFLIEQGCQINRQCVKGETALHNCAESNSMNIMRLLVKNGAILRCDSFGLTPLLTASMNGHIEMFYYLKSVFKCSIEDEVDAYKLLGVTYVDKFYDLTKAYKFWRKAAILYERCNRKYQERLTREQTELYRKAYANKYEFRNEDDLINVFHDPESMKLQAMIIRERILGLHHPESFYFLRYNCSLYMESGEYLHCLWIWIYTLEQIYLKNSLSEITETTFISLMEIFSLVNENNPDDLTACDIEKVFRMVMSQILISCNIIPENGQSNRVYKIGEKNKAQLVKNWHSLEFAYSYHHDVLSGFDQQFLVLIHLIGYMCQRRSKLSLERWEKFETLIRQLLACDPRSTNSHSLLHIICIITSTTGNLILPVIDISLFDIFKLVVDLSHNLNLIDIRGYTPLHFLLEREKFFPQMIEYLLESGAHPDLSNVEGLTPVEYLEKGHERTKREDDRILRNFKVKYITLQCLSAKTILEHNLSLECLPKNLYQFVQQHRRHSFFLGN